jgi:flagellar M-ring protein FliF
MADPRQLLAAGRSFAARIPIATWLAAMAIGAALVAVMYLEMSGPRYATLYEGLTPSEGGKVIAGLQKLGIPYQLAAAGNLIQVPVNELSLARLQLGAQQIPGSDASAAWQKLEEAPLTASDLAQSTMASQALEQSLEQSIEHLDGVGTAQVFLAIPRDTPFLADQPKPGASVLIEANGPAATSLGPTIAHLVAGAVPGLLPGQITVTTTSGLRLFPSDESKSTIASQMMTISQIEGDAAARVSELLTPILGANHFRVVASADVDFTHVQTHEILYGPGQMRSSQDVNKISQIGQQTLAMGIPGALSNEPPSATTATPAPVPVAANGQPAPATGATPAKAANSAATAQAQLPSRKADSSKIAYLTDRRESDITTPTWKVKALAVSLVLDRAALQKNNATQIKSMLAGAFSFPKVTVSVLSVPFVRPSPLSTPFNVQSAIGPLSQAVLEVVAALALLFGLALPLGRRISAFSLSTPILSMPESSAPSISPAPRAVDPPLAPPLPARPDFISLREEASRNVPAVARLLQSWVEENE